MLCDEPLRIHQMNAKKLNIQKNYMKLKNTRSDLNRITLNSAA